MAARRGRIEPRRGRLTTTRTTFSISLASWLCLCLWLSLPGCWECSGVMRSTLIADLDGDKKPEIIAETLNNTIIALHGKDCSVYFEKPLMFAQNEGHMAIADLDGDKKPEIVVLGGGNKVM